MRKEEFEKAHPGLKEEMMLEEDKASAELVGAKVEAKSGCGLMKCNHPNCITLSEVNKVEDKPKWEEEMDEVLEDTIIDGGFDYSKQDAWIDATEARKRIKAFLAKQKELSYKEGLNEGITKAIEIMEIKKDNK